MDHTNAFLNTLSGKMKMTLGEFLVDDTFGESWADDDFDINSISAPIGKPPSAMEGYNHFSDNFKSQYGNMDRRYNNEHSMMGGGGGGGSNFHQRKLEPPFIAKFSNLSESVTKAVIQELFDSRFLKFERCKVLIDPNPPQSRFSNPNAATNVKKCAYVQFDTSQELLKVVKWNDIYMDRLKVQISVADFTDFRDVQEYNKEIGYNEDDENKRVEELKKLELENQNQNQNHNEVGDGIKNGKRQMNHFQNINNNNRGFDNGFGNHELNNRGQEPSYRGNDGSFDMLNNNNIANNHNNNDYYSREAGTAPPPVRRVNPFGEAKPVEVHTPVEIADHLDVRNNLNQHHNFNNHDPNGGLNRNFMLNPNINQINHPSDINNGISNLDNINQIQPIKRFNPFGNAKPVDTLSKQLELEKKLKDLAINETTFKTMASLEHEQKQKELELQKVKEKEERQRLEKERLEKKRLEKEILEKERFGKEKLEKEKSEKIRIERQKKDNDNYKIQEDRFHNSLNDGGGRFLNPQNRFKNQNYVNPNLRRQNRGINKLFETDYNHNDTVVPHVSILKKTALESNDKPQLNANISSDKSQDTSIKQPSTNEPSTRRAPIQNNKSRRPRSRSPSKRNQNQNQKGNKTYHEKLEFRPINEVKPKVVENIDLTVKELDLFDKEDAEAIAKAADTSKLKPAESNNISQITDDREARKEQFKSMRSPRKFNYPTSAKYINPDLLQEKNKDQKTSKDQKPLNDAKFQKELKGDKDEKAEKELKGQKDEKDEKEMKDQKYQKTKKFPPKRVRTPKSDNSSNNENSNSVGTKDFKSKNIKKQISSDSHSEPKTELKRESPDKINDSKEELATASSGSNEGSDLAKNSTQNVDKVDKKDSNGSHFSKSDNRGGRGGFSSRGGFSGRGGFSSRGGRGGRGAFRNNFISSMKYIKPGLASNGSKGGNESSDPSAKAEPSQISEK